MIRLLTVAALVCAAVASNKKCMKNECKSKVKVTIYNVAPAQGTFQTPVWVGFHDGTFDLYDRDVSLDGFGGMESLVEDGSAAGLTERFAEEQRKGQDATLPGPNGPIFPGEMATMTFTINPVNQQYFSFASMVIPSNDAFIANGDPMMFKLFDDKGRFMPVDRIVAGAMVLDGGTEENDEDPANTAALEQASPNTGVTEGGVVTSHPGFDDAGNILAAIPNGDFTADGYELVRVKVELVGDSCGKKQYCRLAYTNKKCGYHTECAKQPKRRRRRSRRRRRKAKATTTPAPTTKAEKSKRRRRRRRRD